MKSSYRLKQKIGVKAHFLEEEQYLCLLCMYLQEVSGCKMTNCKKAMFESNVASKIFDI